MIEELEARLLASIRNAEQFQDLVDAHVDETGFEHFGPMFLFISRTVANHGQVPRLLDLKQTFNLPDSVTRDRQEFPTLFQEFRRLLVAKKLQDVIDKQVQTYGEDPDQLLSSLTKELMTIQAVSRRQMSVSDQSMLERLDRYEKEARQLRGRIKGIPTGIVHFDEVVRLGWLPGDLVGIVGRTYLGKSWMLVYFGVCAWQAGHSVLFVSPEMTIEETEARLDALLAAKHDIPVEVTELYRGYVPSEKFRELASKVSSSQRWMTYTTGIESSLSLAELGRLLRQYKPDILIVDGLPLLESRRQQIWESIKDLSYGLKNLAVSHNLPILVSHQANRQAYNTARPPGLHEISMGDAFAQACDRVLALSRPKVEGDDVLRITVQKFRKGKPMAGGTDFRFDPERGKIHELLSRDTKQFGVEPYSLPQSQRTADEVSLP